MNPAPQIRTMLDLLNRTLGIQNKATFHWDRTGANEFDLLNPQQPLTTEAIYGRLGQFRVDLSNPLYPVAEPCLRYEVRGHDLKVETSIILVGMADKLCPSHQEAVGAVGASPVGFGPMTALSVLSMIWSLLHSRVTLNLPGNVEVSLELLDENILRVDFVRGPSVKVVCGFEMNVVPTAIALTEHSATLFYPGPLFGRPKQKVWEW